MRVAVLLEGEGGWRRVTGDYVVVGGYYNVREVSRRFLWYSRVCGSLAFSKWLFLRYFYGVLCEFQEGRETRL